MRKNPWLWMGIAAPGFAFGFPITKYLFESGLSVWQIMIPRFVVATMAVWVVMSFGRRRKVEHAWSLGLMLGVVNMAATSVLMGLGTDLLPSSVAGILTAFIPLATAGAAHWIVAGERFTANRIPGAVVATFGVTLLVVGGGSEGDRVSLPGIGVLLAGVACAGVGGSLNRRFTQRVGVSSLVVPQYVGSTVAIALVGTPLGGGRISGFTFEQWALVLALALFSTAIPFVAILKAFQMTSAARAALVGYLVPLLAAASSIVLLDEAVTVSFLTGGALIVVGVIVADRSERRLRMAAPI